MFTSMFISIGAISLISRFRAQPSPKREMTIGTLEAEMQEHKRFRQPRAGTVETLTRSEAPDLDALEALFAAFDLRLAQL